MANMPNRAFERMSRRKIYVIPPDTVPDAFSFPDQVAAALATYIVADTFAITGTNAPSPIFATGAGEYRIEDGDWTQALGYAEPNAAIGYRVLSSDAFDTESANELSIGGVTASMLVRTAAADITPDTLTFTAVTDADRSTHYQQSYTVTGINAEATVSATGGATVSIAGGDLTTSGSITNGQSLLIDVLSSSSYEALAHGIVTIGGLEIVCDVTTMADPSPTPSPTPSATVTQPKEGPADYTVSFSGLTTQTQRQNAIKAAMTQAYNDMLAAPDPLDSPFKIAIPAGDCGSIFFIDREYPSLLSVVPVDYENPPTFWRFANAYGGSGTGLSNVVFDGFRIDYTAATDNGALSRTGPVIAFTKCNDLTLSNWKINTGYTSGTGVGRLITILGCTDFTAYRIEGVGGGDYVVMFGQYSTSANPCVRPRLLQSSFRNSNEDGIRPWGAQDFLIDEVYYGNTLRDANSGHADGLQIAQVSNPNAFPSNGIVSNSAIVQVDAANETTGFFMTDANVDFSDITFDDNITIGCGLNAFKTWYVTSGLVMRRNIAYDTSAVTGIVASRIGIFNCTDATLEDNKAAEFIDSGSTYLSNTGFSTTGVFLTTQQDVDDTIDAWKAAHPDVPFTMPELT